MKRIGISLAGGVGIILVLVACMSASNRQSALESVFLWVLAFPMLIFYPLFPPHRDPGDPFAGFPTLEAMIAAALFDVLFYSGAAYVILRWVEKRRRSAGEVQVEAT